MRTNDVEEWAQVIVANELRREVELHDNGSQPRMYDLRVGPIDAPDIAIEVTRAADPKRMEASKVTPSDGVIAVPSLNAVWVVVVNPSVRRKASARRKGLVESLGPILGDLEKRLTGRRLHGGLGTMPASDRATLTDLGVTYARPSWRDTGESGLILRLTPIGGDVDHAGVEFSDWIGRFLSEPDRDDVRRKLRQANASESHVFVPVDYGGAPWPVESFLAVYGPDGKLSGPPASDPVLPEPVTHVWVVSTWARSGWRWDRQEWRQFRATEQP